MTLELKTLEKQTQVFLTGSIYEEDSIEIAESLALLIASGEKKILIDFSQVDYIHDSTLVMLFTAHNRALNNDCTMLLSGLTANVKQKFDLSHMTKMFNFQ